MYLTSYLAAFTAMATAVHARSSNQPGYCEDDESCEKNYVCISVQTTRSGIEGVKQCLPYAAEGDVCSGTFSGLCPSFSTWDTAFQSISSVCAYQLPSGTDKCLNDSTSSDTEGFVSCLDIAGASDGDVGVIFGCVDFDGTNLLFEEDSDNWDLSSKMNYTALINDGCVNPKNGDNSDVVCSGRGTCAPLSSGEMDYQCDCNVGYNGTYCQNIVSNKCTLESQCQAGTCNLATQECECDPGTTGDQCAYCDPTSSDACNGHGTCVAAPVSTEDDALNATSTGTTSNVTLATTSADATSNVTSANVESPTSETTADGDAPTSSGATRGTSSSTSIRLEITPQTSPSTGTTETTDAVTRFLQVTSGKTSTSDSGSNNVCKCESGYTGDQCTRKVESDDKKNGTRNNRDSTSSDATSVVTSVALLVSAIVVIFLN